MSTATKRRPKAAEKTAAVKVLLNLREGPGYGHGIIGTLQPGETLHLRGQELDGFAAVLTERGESGWVCTDFIEVSTGV